MTLTVRAGGREVLPQWLTSHDQLPPFYLAQDR